ncbi:N-chimaerin [Zancudomyces culisetae]|uniref:N-chimaerin n=1 Tax=Zancudomyces culisetae TaxID=1213189 RepID=A0A1R1PUD4_ZANCU|nr:N-chimaerin [Zancudomyces culisetae]|eukprot:OMH84561.1 N-chimaerin [Zancudomyces culisetae]
MAENFSTENVPTNKVMENREFEVREGSEETLKKRNEQEEILELAKIKGAFELLLEKARISLMTCKEAAVFLKKRSLEEEEYGRGLQRLAGTTNKMTDRGGGKVDSFGVCWSKAMELHDQLAANRTKFSLILLEMAEDLMNYCKEKEKTRKQLKDAETQYYRVIEESEGILEKVRTKYETQAMDWEKILVKKSEKMDQTPKYGAKPKNVGNTMTGIFRQNKTVAPEILERQEQEARIKAKIATEQYKQQLEDTNLIREEYYKVQLPKILMTTKMFLEEIDNALKWHLGKYSYAYECAILSDALTIKPNSGSGLMDIVSSIDNENDLRLTINEWSTKLPKYEFKNISYYEYKMLPAAHYLANRKQVFGVMLSQQLRRDGKKVPSILVKCAEMVEATALKSEGIYRLSGQSSVVQKIKAEFDFNSDAVNLNIGVYRNDINSITGVLKMYFRELPGGLITSACAVSLTKALANSSNVTNDVTIDAFRDALERLPYGHLDTLSYLMHHLNKVQSYQEFNMMSAPNLSIVFGPTLMTATDAGAAMDVFRSQPKIVEYMLRNVEEIFDKDESDIEEEESEEGDEQSEVEREKDGNSKLEILTSNGDRAEPTNQYSADASSYNTSINTNTNTSIPSPSQYSREDFGEAFGSQVTKPINSDNFMVERNTSNSDDYLMSIKNKLSPSSPTIQVSRSESPVENDTSNADLPSPTTKHSSNENSDLVYEASDPKIGILTSTDQDEDGNSVTTPETPGIRVSGFNDISAPFSVSKNTSSLESVGDGNPVYVGRKPSDSPTIN